MAILSSGGAHMGGATDFKVGYKTGFASGASEKKLYPHFSKCAHGRTRKQIYINELMKKKQDRN